MDVAGRGGGEAGARATAPGVAVRHLARGCRWLLLGGALLALGVYLYVALSRIAYPFELEWMEGQSLVQVDRLLRGQPLYERPSLAYVPFIYPPLYYALAAIVSAVVGQGFLALRLVSFAASLGCCALIYHLVRRDSRDRLAALAAVGLFAATYRLGGAWFDVGRVDTLLLFLLLLGMALLRRETVPAAALAGVCCALALLTKQTAWIALPPPLLACLWRDWRRGLAFGGAALGGAALASGVLNLLSGGWYWYYIFTLPSHHAALTAPETVVGFWTGPILGGLPLAALLGCCALVPTRGALAAVPGADRWFHASMALGFLGLAWAGWLNSGSYDNVLLPACASVAILAGLGLGRLGQVARATGANWALAAQAAACLLCLGQVFLLRYAPAAQLPTAADRQANQRLVDTLRQAPGEVFVPYHSYLALLAGKQPYAHYTALAELRGDYGGGKRAAEWAAIQRDLTLAIRERRFAAIVLDEEWPKEGLDCCYRGEALIYAVPTALVPVTGWQTRPQYLYLPREGAGSGR